MTFQCLRRACLIYFPAKLRLFLVLKTRGIVVDFSFSLMKCWRSSKLIEESALESSASLFPLAESFSMKKPFFLTNVSRLLLLLLFLFIFVCWVVCLFVCLFIHRRWNNRRWVADGIKTCMCKNCPVSVFFVWHLMSRILFHQIVSLCKYSLYRGAKYTRSYSLQPETRPWRSFHISFSGRYAQRNIPDKYRSMVYVLKTKVRAHTLRSTWLRKDSFIKIHARNISCT